MYIIYDGGWSNYYETSSRKDRKDRSTPYNLASSRGQPPLHHIEHQQQVLQLLKDNLVLAQNRMKQQADQHRSEISFDVGDWVFLRLQPVRVVQTLKNRRMGPHQVGAVSGSSKGRKSIEEVVGQDKNGDRKDRSQNNKEGPSL